MPPWDNIPYKILLDICCFFYCFSYGFNRKPLQLLHYTPRNKNDKTHLHLVGWLLWGADCKVARAEINRNISPHVAPNV